MIEPASATGINYALAVCSETSSRSLLKTPPQSDYVENATGCSFRANKKNRLIGESVRVMNAILNANCIDVVLSHVMLKFQILVIPGPTYYFFMT